MRTKIDLDILMKTSGYLGQQEKIIKQYKYAEVINQEDLQPDFKEVFEFEEQF